jgi:hypothetical protein
MSVVAAATVLVMAGIGGWVWMRSHPRSGGQPPASTPGSGEATGGGAATPAPDTTPPTPDPAGGTIASPGVPPAAPVGPGAAPIEGIGAPAAAPGTAPPLARGRSTRGSAPADTLLTFGDSKVVVITGRRSEEQDATIHIGGGQISIVAKHGGAIVSVVRYGDLKRATYARGRDPKWDTTLAAPGADVDFPGGLFRSARHWLALQSPSTFIILRLSDAAWRQVVEAVTARTGVPVRQVAGG